MSGWLIFVIVMGVVGFALLPTVAYVWIWCIAAVVGLLVALCLVPYARAARDVLRWLVGAPALVLVLAAPLLLILWITG